MREYILKFRDGVCVGVRDYMNGRPASHTYYRSLKMAKEFHPGVPVFREQPSP